MSRFFCTVSEQLVHTVERGAEERTGSLMGLATSSRQLEAVGTAVIGVANSPDVFSSLEAFDVAGNRRRGSCHPFGQLRRSHRRIRGENGVDGELICKEPGRADGIVDKGVNGPRHEPHVEEDVRMCGIDLVGDGFGLRLMLGHGLEVRPSTPGAGWGRVRAECRGHRETFALRAVCRVRQARRVAERH